MADETQEGVAANQAMTLNERRTAAYNAINAAHGPVMADSPENYLAVANAAAQAPLAPQAAQAVLANTQAEAPLKQAQTATATENATGLQQTNQVNAGIRGAAMLSAIANPDGSIPADEATHILQNPVYGIDPAHVQPMVDRLSQPGGKDLLDQMTAALRSGGKISGGQTVVTNPDGTTSIVRSTQSGGVVESNLGGAKTAPQQQAITGAGSLQERMKHDSDMLALGYTRAQIQAYNAGRGANNSLYGAAPGTTLPTPGGGRSTAPTPGGAQPAPGGGRSTAPTPGGAQPAPGANTIPPDSLFAKLPPKGKQQAIGQATQIVNQGSNLQSTNQILDTVMKQITPYTTGTGALLSKLPGTAQTDLKANLTTLKAQGLTSWIQSLKNGQGQTGIGRVLQSEANAAMNLFGNMEQDQSAKQLAFHAQLFRRTVNSLYQHAQDGFHSQYGVDAHSALGEPAAPGSGGALPDGWKYLGAQKQ